MVLVLNYKLLINVAWYIKHLPSKQLCRNWKFTEMLA